MEEQELMFDDPADRHEYYEQWVEQHCRPTHPSTSMEAAEKIAPRVGTNMLLALELVQENPRRTAAELDKIAGYGNGTIRKRLSDLRAKGLARVVGKRKCRITGMNAQVWEAVE